MVAMMLSEKHEKKPTRQSTTRKSRFRRTANFSLDSASVWDDFNLELLNVDFRAREYAVFPEEVLAFPREKCEEDGEFRERIAPFGLID